VLQELGAHQAVDAGPAGEAEDQHDRADAAAEHRREREDQEDARHRGEHVVDPLEQVADPAAEEARGRAEERADRRRQQGGAHADEDRHLRALDRLGQHVAAEAVATERQRRGLDAFGRLVLLRRLFPFLVARRERVDRRDVDVRSARRRGGDRLRRRRRPDEGGRRVRHAALGLPVARDQTDGGRDDEEDEERDDDERDDADAVAAKASRCRRPDAGRAARRCRCRNRRPHHRAHDSTTRGSTSL
jgi:hypothetical protein